MRAVQLRDLCQVITKGTTPTTLGMKLNEGGVNFIKVESLSVDGQFIPEKIQKIDAATHETLKRSQLKAGDILYSIAGSIGRSAIVTEDILPANTNQAVALIRPTPGQVDTDYLFYFLRNKQSQDDAKSRIVQSVQTNLSLGELGNLDVALPERLVQEEIARVMKDLDSKIQINRQISQTLIEIAQSIFKSWFVNFEPVLAKMGGENPIGMDEETAALFPGSFEASTLGMIPAGWTVKRFGDLVIKQKVGKVFSSKESFQIGNVPILDQKDSGKVGFHNEAPGYIATPDKPVVVFGNHTCVVRLIPYEFSAIQNVFPLLSDHADTFWLYFALQGKQNYEGYKGHWPDFILHQSAIPTRELTLKFGEIVKPLFKSKWSLENETDTLEKIRDALLPRLMSGEIRIPDEVLAS